MTTANANTARRAKRRENFPIGTFRYLEARLNRIRKIVMKLAAKISCEEDRNPEAYRVKKRHIDKAFSEFVSDTAKASKLLGADRLTPAEQQLIDDYSDILAREGADAANQFLAQQAITPTFVQELLGASRLLYYHARRKRSPSVTG